MDKKNKKIIIDENFKKNQLVEILLNLDAHSSFLYLPDLNKNIKKQKAALQSGIKQKAPININVKPEKIVPAELKQNKQALLKQAEPSLDKKIAGAKPTNRRVVPKAEQLEPSQIAKQINNKTYSDQDIAAAKSINALRMSISGCDRCPLHKERNRLVFGNFPVGADILIIGEAPGKDEDLQGDPFVGRAGKLLQQMVGYLGHSFLSLAVTNIVKCRPPENRVPYPLEVQACSNLLNKQIELVNPKLILVVGAVAMNQLLPEETNITKARQKMHSVNGHAAIAVYHPSYLLRNRNSMNLALADFKFIKEYLIKIS